MKEQLDILVDLQKVETEVVIIKQKLSRVVTVLEGLDSRLYEFDSALKESEDRLSDMQKQYRQYESDVQENISRIKKSQEKLRSVKNNKEYQSILKEIEDIQTKNSLIEDEMIVCLDRMEVIEETLKVKKTEVEQVKVQVENEKATVKQDADQNGKRLAQLENEIEQISSRSDPELLKKYRLVKEQTKGIAIAAVNNAVCQGCNLNIPPQLYIELQRRDSLTFCPHCQRIIYWEETSTEV
jgi:predicted  nucleic acid-binding Zn-ribbon protein